MNKVYISCPLPHIKKAVEVAELMGILDYKIVSTWWKHVDPRYFSAEEMQENQLRDREEM